MDDSDEQRAKDDRYFGIALMEFAKRWCTHVMNRDMMSVEEANAMLMGIANALDTGRQTVGVEAALTEACQRLNDRDTGIPFDGS